MRPLVRMREPKQLGHSTSCWEMRGKQGIYGWELERGRRKGREMSEDCGAEKWRSVTVWILFVFWRGSIYCQRANLSEDLHRLRSNSLRISLYFGWIVNLITQVLCIAIPRVLAEDGIVCLQADGGHVV